MTEDLVAALTEEVKAHIQRSKVSSPAEHDCWQMLLDELNQVEELITKARTSRLAIDGFGPNLPIRLQKSNKKYFHGRFVRAHDLIEDAQPWMSFDEGELRHDGLMKLGRIISTGRPFDGRIWYSVQFVTDEDDWDGSLSVKVASYAVEELRIAK